MRTTRSNALAHPPHLLLAVFALASTACGMKQVPIDQAAATRPSARMTQTDFVIRVVNFACSTEHCKDTGTRAANQGTPGVRATVNEMCFSHVYSDDWSSRGEWTENCYERAATAVGDAAIPDLWASCQRSNNAAHSLHCLYNAIDRLVAQGADVPIATLVPGALRDAAPGMIAPAQAAPSFPFPFPMPTAPVFAPPAVPAVPTASAPPVTEARSTEERLQELRTLRDKGLIDQPTYDRKAQEIVDKL